MMMLNSAAGGPDELGNNELREFRVERRVTEVGNNFRLR